MINLFSLIANEVRNKQELFDNEGKIMEVLLNSGCRLYEADAALSLMQHLAQQESEDLPSPKRPPAPVRMRAMTREERDRFTVEAFGFLAKLTHLGIISEDQREDLVEKALTTYTERIDLDHIKNLIAFVLFAGFNEGEHGPSQGIRRIKNTAWN